MRDFQKRLTIALALALCGLCVYQWQGQVSQRAQIAKLNRMVYDKMVAIQGYTNSMANMDQRIAEMDVAISNFRQDARTNELQLALRARELDAAKVATRHLADEISEYKKGVEGLEAKLKEAYQGIEKQNQAIKTLTAQRDEFVEKYNQSVEARNALVAKYNALVEQVNKPAETKPKP